LRIAGRKVISEIRTSATIIKIIIGIAANTLATFDPICGESILKIVYPTPPQAAIIPSCLKDSPATIVSSFSI
jgi:hypothetical protein